MKTKKVILNIFMMNVLLKGLLVAQTGWLSVSGFGTNPGNLNMYKYVPTAITGTVPLVVVMHGCSQTAATYAAQSGWNKLADQHQFYVVYPEQNVSNNSSSCFNWFQSSDQERGQGEALSIKQMVDDMKSHYNIDSTKVFVTGLSGGACMTNVMLACYPEVFAKGAVMAGVPYKAATSSLFALNAMYGYITYTPQNWGNFVSSQSPAYTGSYPKVAVFHGNFDNVVSINNVPEIVKQWTYLHGADQIADGTINSFNGNSSVKKNIYNNAGGQEVMETYTITGMAHGIALDTGSCYQQGGQTGTYALEVNLFSSFWAANFFDIINTHAPFAISGLQTVAVNQSGVTYSVPLVSNTTYTWTAPANATITGGQGTNQITVSFSGTPGNISVTETNASACKVGPVNLWVNMNTVTGVSEIPTNSDIRIYPNPITHVLNIHSKKNLNTITLSNLLGEIIYSKEVSSREASINLESLPTGFYLISLQKDGEAPVIKKIYKQSFN